MKVLRFPAIVILAVTLLQTAEGEDRLKSALEFYSGALREAIDNDRWKLEVADDSIVIESKFKVGFKPRVNPAVGQEAPLHAYRIELIFKPLLSRDDYVALAKERVEYAATINYGAKTRQEYSLAEDFLRNNPLPRYDAYGSLGKSFSVYVSKSDSPLVSIVPSKLYAEAKGVEALVDSVFWEKAE